MMRSREVRADKKDRASGPTGEEIKPGPVVLRSARLRLAFVECVSAEDLEDVVHGLVIAAREGSVSAARLLLKYVFDKEALAEAEKVAESAGEWELPLTPDPSPPSGEGRNGGGLSDPGRGEGRSGGGLSDLGSGEGRSDGGKNGELPLTPDPSPSRGEGRMGGGNSDRGWHEGRIGVYEEDADFPLTPDPSPSRGEGRSGGAESGKAIVVEERSGRGPIMHVDLARLYREADGKLEKQLEMIPWDEIARLVDEKDGPGLGDGDPPTPCVGSDEPAFVGSDEPACVGLDEAVGDR